MNATETNSLKRLVVAALAITTLLCLPAGARTTTEDTPEIQVDPAGEIRHQDWAFSLLVEAYRQIQNNLIESDYENRVRDAAHLPAAARNEVLTLAKQERELRVRKLCVQLGNFGIAYDHARQTDQEREGVTLPHEVNTDAAADVLKDFVVITPPSGRSLPADAVLRDKRPAL